MRLFVRPEAPALIEADATRLGIASWVLLDDEGAVRSQGSGNPAPLADLAGSSALADPANVIILVPAERCLSVQCLIPGRGPGQIRRALPFAVEEHLASDLDAVHIASGPIRRQQPIDVLVIERALLRGWVDALSAIGLVPGYAFADANLLAAGPDTITVLFDEARALIRTPRQCLAVESDLATAAVAGALAEIDPSRELSIVVVNGEIPAIARAELEQGRTGKIAWQSQETDAPALTHLARGYAPGLAPINLLVGEFAPPRRHNEGWQKWRAVAVLAGVWLLLGLAGMVARGYWAESRAAKLGADAEALYRQYFPADQRVQDVYRQMQAHLGTGSGEDTGFMALVGDLAQVVTAATGAQIRSLAFNSDRLELNAEVAVPGFDRLDKIKSDLSGRGLSVEITSAEQQDQGVLARLRIKGVS